MSNMTTSRKILKKIILQFIGLYSLNPGNFLQSLSLNIGFKPITKKYFHES